MFPTGMTFGPDGDLYISNTGFGPPAGQILRVELRHDEDFDEHHHRDYDHEYYHRGHHYEKDHYRNYHDHHDYRWF